MAYINNIHCLPAAHKYPQQELVDFIENNMGVAADRKMELLFKSLKSKNWIQSRHSCLGKEYFQADSPLNTLSTAGRQQLYELHSDSMLTEVVKQAHITEAINNLVTVSCTGYQTPGLELQLNDKLKLAKTPFRYHIGAMGCYAGLVGLRLAGNLSGNSLLLCLELCSIHFQKEPLNFSNLVSNYLFGDGAALVQLSEKQSENSICKLHSFGSKVIPNTATKMSWLLRDTGFIMHLDSEVSNVIGNNIREAAEDWLAESNLKIADVEYWIVHPGSHSIIQSVKKALHLSDEAIESSLNVLRNYGNMSSGTVFFILKDLLSHKKIAKGKKVGMLAFGPGLNAEMALLEGI